MNHFTDRPATRVGMALWLGTMLLVGVRGQERGPAQLGGGPGARSVSPLERALDRNGDGELSAAEIRAAADSLAALDRNRDGKLTREELRPGLAETGGFAGREGGPGGQGLGPGGGDGGRQAGVRSVMPQRVELGSKGVELRITLNTDSFPPIPPVEVKPSRVWVGPYSSSSCSRQGNEVRTVVDIPAVAKPGKVDVVVEFPGPPGGGRTIRIAGGKALGIAGGERADSPLPKGLSYAVVDTGQTECYNAERQVAPPAKGAPFAGQDAQYSGWQPRYRDNGDGTVSDLVTGLMWQRDPGAKVVYAEAVKGAKACRTGGHDDWRLPSIKQLYSLIDFNGSIQSMAPYIDTDAFVFSYPDTRNGQARIIDAQYWSSTEYVGKVMRGADGVFGVNFADGRIKCYPRDRGRLGGASKQFCRYVRGNPEYGRNDFVDNGDGTVTDRATGLMWQKQDSGKGMNWEQALAYAEGLQCAGHDDWRLPNAKELQSIVDYRYAPDAVDPELRRPAIDPVFELTERESWFWTGTTHLDHGCGFAVYIAFGQAFGVFPDRQTNQRQLVNVHGAGAQRSDPKSGDPSQWVDGFGPQRDQRRVLNYVRGVRDASAKR